MKKIVLLVSCFIASNLANAESASQAKAACMQRVRSDLVRNLSPLADLERPNLLVFNRLVNKKSSELTAEEKEQLEIASNKLDEIHHSMTLLGLESFTKERACNSQE